MKTPAQLEDLGRLSRLVLDERLSALRRAQRARQVTLDRISALNCPPVTMDVSLMAAQRADVNYQIWADQRRMQLNMTLARQTVTSLQAVDAARQAFAKNSMLVRLRAQLKPAP